MSQADLDFARYCCDLCSSAGPCVSRRMFGGFGISTEGLTLAIIADLGQGQTLWLKADEDTRARFEAEGCARFTYDVAGVPKSMNYYSAPPESMESPALMAPWVRLSLEAALRARAAKPAPRPRAPKAVKVGKVQAAAQPVRKTAARSASAKTGHATTPVTKRTTATVAKPKARPKSSQGPTTPSRQR